MESRERMRPAAACSSGDELDLANYSKALGLNETVL